MTTESLSPFGIAINQFKKAAKKYDPKVSSGIEYKMMQLLEQEAKEREKFDLQINLMEGVRELQRQYRQLFIDYAAETGKFSTEEDPFDVIIKNEDSAYNKVTVLINQLSKIKL